MTRKKEALNSKGNILVVGKHARCWYCQLHGYSICDEWGCCKRCGTNLKKWSSRGKLIYPTLNDERLAQEVLGLRTKCDIPSNSGASQNLPIFKLSGEKERSSGKVNHCHICWQKTLIFIWSTSRAIDKEKLGQIEQFKDVVNLERLAFPICKACVKEHELLEEKYATQKI